MLYQMKVSITNVYKNIQRIVKQDLNSSKTYFTISKY